MYPPVAPAGPDPPVLPCVTPAAQVPIGYQRTCVGHTEANNMDLVVTPEIPAAYDFASRVRATLDQLKKDSLTVTVRQQLDALPKSDLKRIVVTTLDEDPVA